MGAEIDRRIDFYLRGGYINTTSCSNVEFAVCIEAGSRVIKGLRVLTEERDHKQMLDGYISIMSSLPTDMFENVLLQDLMKLRITNAHADLEGGNLWNKFKLVRQEILNSYLTKLPRQSSDLPSGKNWRDTYDRFILDRYKFEYVSKIVCSILPWHCD